PDFETPGDANGDNDYQAQVTVTDSGGLTAVQDITVSVTDVAEDEPLELIGTFRRDTLTGGENNDFISGRGGKDLLVGNGGDDTINGGFGRDTIQGGEGNDTIDGGFSRDTIRGGGGDDNITGGFGRDTFVLAAGEGTDTITDFGDGDLIGLVNGDLIGLADGLTFADLSFAGNAISFGSETLANLTGVDTTTLTEADFVLI
nr:hypothetical protein [Pleurocapsa sp. MO_226.B13]